MKYEQTLQDLASELVYPEREFPPATPHTYAHIGEVATMPSLYPDLPAIKKAYNLPPFRNGQSGVGQ